MPWTPVRRTVSIRRTCRSKGSWTIRQSANNNRNCDWRRLLCTISSLSDWLLWLAILQGCRRRGWDRLRNALCGRLSKTPRPIGGIWCSPFASASCATCDCASACTRNRLNQRIEMDDQTSIVLARLHHRVGVWGFPNVPGLRTGTNSQSNWFMMQSYFCGLSTISRIM